MEAFFISTGLVALGEIGDKTQLLAILLAARFRKPLPIVLGILVGGFGLLAWRTPVPLPAALVDAPALLPSSPLTAAPQAALQDGRARGPHSRRA